MLIMNWLMSEDDLIVHVKQTVRQEKKKITGMLKEKWPERCITVSTAEGNKG